MPRQRKPLLHRLEPAARDAFVAAVTEALEHVDAPEWLARFSPLAGQNMLRADPDGRRALNPASRLQAALTAARDAAGLEPLERAVLDATYFDRRAWNADNLNIIGLARQIGERHGITWNDRAYYRARNSALAKLAQALTQALAPDSQADAPPASHMFGREREHAQALQALTEDRSLTLIGPSGIGKTTLLASLAHAVRKAGRSCMWFTIRPGLTSHETDLLRALAEFLHTQGQQNAWLYLTTQAPPLNTGKLLSIICGDLLSVTQRSAVGRPLVFIDEADLLGRRTKGHIALRSVVEAIAGHVTLALAGLRTAIATDVLLTLAGLGQAETQGMLHAAGAHDVSADDARALIKRTRGNGALIRTFISLHQAGAPIKAELGRLQHPPTVAGLLDRIRSKLKVDEEILLQRLCVYRTAAPPAAAADAQHALTELERLALIRSENGALRIASHLLPTLRLRLPKIAQPTWHLAAAHLLERHADFSEAMHHYVQGGKPAHAVRLWAEYGRTEIARGRAAAALSTLTSIGPDSSMAGAAHAADWHALLVLQRSKLRTIVGGMAQSRRELNQTRPRSRLLGAHLAAAAAGIASAQGELDSALRQYDDALGLLAGSPEELRTRILASRSHDLRLDGQDTAAASAAVRSHAMAAIFHGSVERKHGRFEAAERLYLLALELCRELASPSVEEALALEHYANMLWMQGRLSEAMDKYVRAEKIAVQRGDVFAQCVIQGGISAVQILSGNYSASRDIALKGLAVARSLGYAPMAGLLASNAAEACYYLDDLDQAHSLVAEAIASEATNIIPNSYWVKAMCALKRHHFAQATADMCLSLQAAQDSNDGYSAAVAWLGLGDIHLAAGVIGDAHSAYATALDYFDRHAISNLAGRARAGLEQAHASPG